MVYHTVEVETKNNKQTKKRYNEVDKTRESLKYTQNRKEKDKNTFCGNPQTILHVTYTYDETLHIYFILINKIRYLYYIER